MEHGIKSNESSRSLSVAGGMTTSIFRTSRRLLLLSCNSGECSPTWFSSGIVASSPSFWHSLACTIATLWASSSFTDCLDDDKCVPFSHEIYDISLIVTYKTLKADHQRMRLRFTCCSLLAARPEPTYGTFRSSTTTLRPTLQRMLKVSRLSVTRSLFLFQMHRLSYPMYISHTRCRSHRTRSQCSKA